MTFAGNQQYVAFGQQCDGRPNGFGAIGDLDCAGRCGKNLSTDHSGILRARIVVGHDDDVGATRRDLAHDRSFPRVAIAATAEDKNDSPSHIRTESRKRLFERVGLVCIVDENRAAADFPDAFEPPGRAMKEPQRLEYGVRFAAGSDAKPGGDESVG